MEIETDKKLEEFIKEFNDTKEKIESVNNINDAIPIWNELMSKNQDYIMNTEEANKIVLHFVNNNKLIQEIYKKSAESNSEEDIESTIVKSYTEEEYLELQDKFTRLSSDFDNYRKRVAKEKVEATKLSNEKLILDLLDTIDNFDRASKTQGGLSDGIQLTYNTFMKTLEKYGATNFMVDGIKFNSDTMYAITETIVDEDKKGLVVETIEKGYKLGEKIIRFPKVIIGK